MRGFCLKWPLEYAPEVWSLCGGALQNIIQLLQNITIELFLPGYPLAGYSANLITATKLQFTFWVRGLKYNWNIIFTPFTYKLRPTLCRNRLSCILYSYIAILCVLIIMLFPYCGCPYLLTCKEEQGKLWVFFTI